MTDRQMNVSLSLKAEGGAATAAEVEKVKTSLAGVGTAAEQASRKVAQTAGQTAFAMRMLPQQMTDIAVGLSTGQSPFMVLMQQGGQLKDMFGGIGPAITAVGGYVAGLVNPFTVAAAAAAALGYGLMSAFDDTEEPAKNLKTAVGDLEGAIRDVGKAARDISMDTLRAMSPMRCSSASARVSVQWMVQPKRRVRKLMSAGVLRAIAPVLCAGNG